METQTSAAAPLTKNKRGRPTLKTDAMIERICNEIESGATIEAIGRRKNFPNQWTIYRWLSEDKGFSEKLSRARKLRTEVWEEQMEDNAQRCAETHEAVAKQRLIFQIRSFIMAKDNPRFDAKGVQIHNTVQQGVMISPERLKELQDRSREACLPSTTDKESVALPSKE